jgi:hypothetical protein
MSPSSQSEAEHLEAETAAVSIALLNQVHAVHQMWPEDSHVMQWLTATYADLCRQHSFTHIYVLTGHPDLPTPWGLYFFGEALTSTVGSDGVDNLAVPSIFKKPLSQYHAEAVGTHQLQCADTKQSVDNWLSNNDEVEYDSAGDADSDAE